MRRLADAAHAAGAVVVVDACQYVPHLPTDVAELGADFLAFSGHKMCGPTGIGVLWGRAELLDATPPFMGGGEMIRDVRLDGYTPNELPWKFEAGTPPIAEAIGLGCAVAFLEGLGMEAVRRHEVDLTAYATRALADRYGDDVTVHGPSEPAARGGVLSFAFKGIHPHDVSQVLDQRGVCVRARPPLRQAAHAPAGRGGDGPRLVLRVQRPRRRRRPGRRAGRLLRPLRPLTTLRRREEPVPGLEDLYREIILDHYRNPRNRGELPAPPAVRVEGFNPLCGDEIVLFLEVADDRVRDVAVAGQGCSISQSSASMMSEAVKGRSLDEVRTLSRSFKALMSIHESRLEGDEDDGDGADDAPAGAAVPLGDLEALQGVVKFPVRIKCATLGWNTLAEALDEAAADARA